MYKILSLNKKARLEFEILLEFEAGMSLIAPQVKEIRKNSMSLYGISCFFHLGEIYLYNPLKNIKLLLKRKEINKLLGNMTGHILIPLALVERNGLFKLQIALAKKLKKYDMRKKIEEKDRKKISFYDELKI